ncbi:MAG: redoxin domain-containing protein [Calditrichota bacterium]
MTAKPNEEAFMGLMDVYNENRVKPAGSPAPDFELPDQDGNEVSLQQLMNEGLVLLFFYSRDGDPGVSQELATLNEYYKKFRRLKIVPVDGISNMRMTMRLLFHCYLMQTRK